MVSAKAKNVAKKQMNSNSNKSPKITKFLKEKATQNEFSPITKTSTPTKVIKTRKGLSEIKLRQENEANPAFLKDWIENKANEKSLTSRQNPENSSNNSYPTIELDRLENLGNETPPVQFKKDKAPENIGNVKVKTSPRIKGKFSPAEISARLRLFEQSKNKIVGLSPVIDDVNEKTIETEKPFTDEIPIKTFQSIQLPIPYDGLLETFKYIDRSVSMFHNSRKQCFFQNLKQIMSSNSLQLHFTLKLFKQILQIAKNMYTVSKVKVARYGPNLDCKYDYCVKFGSKDEDKIIECMPVILTEKIPSKFLVERSRIFYENLVRLAHQRHLIFLKQILGHNAKLPQINSIKRFHPKFESQPIDDLPEFDLEPLDESLDASKLNSTINASLLLDKTKNEFDSLVESSMISSNKSNENSPVPKLEKSIGISEKLLQRIRDKESRKNIENMLISQDVLKERELNEKLDKFVHLIDYMQKTEKKSTILENTVMQKASQSLKIDSQNYMDSLLDLALKKFPKWIKTATIRNSKYIVIDPKVDVTTMLMLLDNKSHD